MHPVGKAKERSMEGEMTLQEERENRIAIKRIEGKQEERAIKLFTSRLLTGTFTAMVAVAVMAVSHIIDRHT